MVFSTHDPAEAAQIASHALLLRSGRVLTVAPVADALTEANLSVCYGQMWPVTLASSWVSALRGGHAST